MLAVVVGQRLGARRRRPWPASRDSPPAGRRCVRNASCARQVAQARREPHGRRVLVRLPRPPSPSSPARAAAAASAAIASPSARLSAGASSAARSQASAAATRTRASSGGSLRAAARRRCGSGRWRCRPRRSPSSWSSGLRVDAVAEGLGGLVVQQVRLVDHHVLERRQRVAAGEQQGVVHADQVRGLGAGARQAPVAAAARGAVAAQAGRPRGAQLAGQVGERGQHLRGPVGQRREVDVAAPRAPDEVGERQRAVRGRAASRPPPRRPRRGAAGRGSSRAP